MILRGGGEAGSAESVHFRLCGSLFDKYASFVNASLVALMLGSWKAAKRTPHPPAGRSQPDLQPPLFFSAGAGPTSSVDHLLPSRLSHNWQNQDF